MTITFFSSVLNHHQFPFCEYLSSQPDVTFHFVQMIPLNEERKKQGFSAYSTPYLVYAEEDRAFAKKLCMDSDVVIAGVIPQEWVNERVASGKLTFAYKERFFKTVRMMLSPRFWRDGVRNYFAFRNQNLYLLCASSYTAKDTAIIFPRPEKKLKWGYFPMTSHYENVEELLSQKEPNTILWAGRFLKLKHPETAIRLAKMLEENGYDFRMTMIGIGPLREELVDRVQKEHMQDVIEILDAVPNEELRTYMRKNDIFLFTSDRNEGWGAIVNEAMSEGCACIASKQAGSTNFLISHGENGYALDYDDIEKWFLYLKGLLDDREAMRQVQKNAIKTIDTKWNAHVAGQRLIEFSRAVLKRGETCHYDDGPMSRA